MTSPPQPVAVFRPVVVGLPTTLTTIAFQVWRCCWSSTLSTLNTVAAWQDFCRDLGIVTAVSMIILSAHLVETAIWAVVLVMCGQDPTAALYLSGMIYTTLN
jgi:hypothetical protein